MIKNVLITGGAGYVGTLLVPQLLAAGYDVTVYDIMYYGCELKPPAAPHDYRRGYSRYHEIAGCVRRCRCGDPPGVYFQRCRL